MCKKTPCFSISTKYSAAKQEKQDKHVNEEIPFYMQAIVGEILNYLSLIFWYCNHSINPKSNRFKALPCLNHQRRVIPDQTGQLRQIYAEIKVKALNFVIDTSLTAYQLLYKRILHMHESWKDLEDDLSTSTASFSLTSLTTTEDMSIHKSSSKFGVLILLVLLSKPENYSNTAILSNIYLTNT
ncbi:hypothetical protein EGR_10719 [Echinococcus granulosus]|uniref:Uncharacterized protein n=1 Tax=Echinococcus granulosus TaxID=6210 RepID=W6U007_ECHGR|nr:hypothetical protein EGR_10719 [Echinococcus granulosus]EUB54420.1 hypothetical protein EGR_10719 [Echinococcus granulosus]